MIDYIRGIIKSYQSRERRLPGGRDWIPAEAYFVRQFGGDYYRNESGWIVYWPVSQFGVFQARKLAEGVRDRLEDNLEGRLYVVLYQQKAVKP